ncbi:GNAT family N-acetyltransferase [Comamonas sp. NLF-1-9]|uniref:GNAT family N-acetyltransferase n=1 Tax=Comamonas sp. NLF-1-9 TaxID=2853163 RepID=UPI001C43DAEB|nr:GNAT family N-acetyltransferase [Comamonas sp. NLF-1-9]QXL84775.1 GNAT family N-acetyltransferase [Comamonas sp. NLF-1-9]
MSRPCPPQAPLQEHAGLAAIDAREWDALLAAQPCPTPFMRHAYLAALHDSDSACARTGWAPHGFTLRDAQGALAGACMLYLKSHSRGEYVFDWAWADAYARHGLAYYPKAVLAVPFTPVPGSRLLARDERTRAALLAGLLHWCGKRDLSSLHLLFAADEDLQAARTLGMAQRDTVQFHWHNRHPQDGRPFRDFEDFLAALSQDKRKKIRQERRRVAQAGVQFRALQGAQITRAHWDFFYACYQRTYAEHGNPPYLRRNFFERMADTMAGNWLLFVAERAGLPIACSLIAVSADGASESGEKRSNNTVAYGRYWGALERVDCLHFEACYYQPIAWCIAHGVRRFEGGAQGEHKLARALLPSRASSAHWIAHPAFARAIDDFAAREGTAVAGYQDELRAHSPFRHSP